MCCFQRFSFHLRIRTGVNLSCFNLHMAKEIPDVMKINVCTEQVHCFEMTDHMWSNPFFAFLPGDLSHVLI